MATNRRSQSRSKSYRSKRNSRRKGRENGNKRPQRPPKKDQLSFTFAPPEKTEGGFVYAFKNWYLDNIQVQLEKKPFRITVGIITILFIIGTLAGVFIDRKKSFSHIGEDEISYQDHSWKNKVDDEGYTYHKGGGGSFQWKADIYVPDKSFVFIVKDVAEMTFKMRAIEGTVKIPSQVTFQGMEKYPVIDNYRVVTDKKELELETNVHFASILGLDFVSAFNSRTLDINGKKGSFNSVTIHLPEKSKIVKKGDGVNAAGVYDITKNDIFFHNFVFASIVYYQSSYHLIIQLLILFSIILLTITTLSFIRLLKKMDWRIKGRHILIAIAVCSVVMVVFSALFPNPKPIVLNWDNRLTSYETEGFIASDSEIPNYLWWVLGMTRSVDAFIIGQTSNCGLDVYSHFYLTKYSTDKFFIIDSYQNSRCANFVKTLAPKKTEVISEVDLRNRITGDYNLRKYPPFSLFKINAKIIVLLSNLVVGLCLAYLIYKALQAKGIIDGLIVVAYGFISFFFLMFLYILSGTLIHMPITYHAKNSLGLILTNYFMPGVIAGGNNLRTLFALLGLFLTILVIKKIRNRINLLLVPATIAFGLIFFVIPPTEYFAKRILITMTSAEAYQWDYKQDSFNPFDLYKSIRDNTLAKYLENSFSEKEKGEREIIFSESLITENRLEESIDVNREIIEKFEEFPDIKTDAYYGLGEAYYMLVHENIILPEFYWDVSAASPSHYYCTKSIEYYSIYIAGAKRITNDQQFRVSRSMLHRGLCQLNLRNYDKAILSFQENLQNFPNNEYTTETYFYLGETYQKARKFDEAIIVYQEFIKKYPQSDVADNAELRLTESYLNKREFNIAYLKYLELFRKYPTADYIPIARYDAAYTYERLKVGKEKAIQNYFQVLYDFPNDSNVVYLTIGRINLLTSVNKRDFTQSYLSVLANDRKGSDRTAERGYKELLKTTTDNTYKMTLLFRLADVYKRSNRLTQVREVYHQIIALDPGAHAAIHARLEIAKMDDDKKKMEEYQKEIHDYLSRSATKIPSPEESILTIKDSDNDGLFDVEEDIYGTDPESADTDNDSISDGDEIMQQTDPLAKNEKTESPKNNADQTSPKESPDEKQEQIEASDSFIKNLYRVSMDRAKLSRGMTLYFTGIFAIAMVLLLGKSFRTTALVLIFFLLARGVTRIGEQDPFRAIASIYPAIVSSIQFIVVLLAINFVLFAIGNAKYVGYKAKVLFRNFTMMRSERNVSLKKIWNIIRR